MADERLLIALNLGERIAGFELPNWAAGYELCCPPFRMIAIAGPEGRPVAASALMPNEGVILGPSS